MFSLSFRRSEPKVVSPNDFFDLAAIAERLSAFEGRYNTVSGPSSRNSPETTSTISSGGSLPTTKTPPGRSAQAPEPRHS